MDEPRPDDAAEAQAEVNETRALRRLEAAEAALDALIEAQQADGTVGETSFKKAAQDLIKAQAALSYERQKYEQDLRRRSGGGPSDIDFAKIRCEIRERLDRIRHAKDAEIVR